MEDIFDRITLDEKSPQGDIFDQVSYQEESPLKEAGRHIARSSSRIVESLGGLPGDILRTAQIGARGLEKGASSVREKIGLSPIVSTEKKPGIPGSEELKEFSQRVFGEIVTPQNKKESFIDDVISDASVLAIPLKGKIPFVRSIGTALAGNVGQEAAKQLGFGEKGQVAAKIGSFFLAGLTGKGSVKKYWNQQYKLAEDSVPRNASVSANKIDRRLTNLQHELEKGIETPSKKFVEKPIKNIKSKISNGSIDVDELVEMKKDLNELRSKLYDELTGKQSISYAQGKINDVAKILDEEIAKYGKQNPTFMEHYRNANEAYAGFHQSKRVGNWIKKVVPISRMGKTSLLLLESIFKPASLPYTAGGYALFKSGELATRIMKNATLRKYYGNLMKDAIKENKAGFFKNLKGLEKTIEKTEPDIFDRLTSEQNADK